MPWPSSNGRCASVLAGSDAATLTRLLTSVPRKSFREASSNGLNAPWNRNLTALWMFPRRPFTGWLPSYNRAYLPLSCPGGSMEHLQNLRLLDEHGKPLSARIEGVLTRLLPRFQRQFPALQDEVALTELLEEAGRRIANREERLGSIEKLHGYAWV